MYPFAGSSLAGCFGSKKPCWEGNTAVTAPNTYTIWNRVMSLTEHTPGAGVICGRKGIDLVERCQANKMRPDTSPAPGATGWENVGTFGWKDYMDIDVKNCDTLGKVVHPPCAFDGGSWTKTINNGMSIDTNGSEMLDPLRLCSSCSCGRMCAYTRTSYHIRFGRSDPCLCPQQRSRQAEAIRSNFGSRQCMGQGFQLTLPTTKATLIRCVGWCSFPSCRLHARFFRLTFDLTRWTQWCAKNEP